MTRPYFGALFVTLVLAAALVTPVAAQQPAAAAGHTVSISEPVLAGGTTLAPGRYEIRFAGTAIENEGIAQRDIEFVRDGQVVARDTAEVVPATEPAGTAGGASRVRVEKLKGGEFIRVSFVEGSDRYLIHLPTTTP